MPDATNTSGHPEERSDEGSRPCEDNRASALPLLTMHCVECDYSLEGLPRDGKCPECGTPIENGFLVLRGHASGQRQDAGFLPMQMALWFFLTSGPNQSQAAMFGAFGFAIRRYWLGIMVLLIISPTLLHWAWRKWKFIGPPHQLWLCEQGFWIRDRVMPIRADTLQKVAWAISATLLAAVVTWSFARSETGGWAMLLLTTVLVMGTLAVTLTKNRDTILVVLPRGSTERFMSWAAMNHAEISENGGLTHDLEIGPQMPTFWGLHRQLATSFSFDGPPADASVVEQRINLWIRLAGRRE